MGADINICIERRIGTDWVLVFTNQMILANKITCECGFRYAFPLITSRNYDYFAKLASVRGNGRPPKGMPDDASVGTIFFSDKDKPDGHSHSYDNLNDFMNIYLSVFRDSVGDLTIKYLESELFGVPEDDDSSLYRVIYWFDN